MFIRLTAAAALLAAVVAPIPAAAQDAPAAARSTAADVPKVVPSLAAHSEEFRKEVIEVAPGVWNAVGFGLANATLIEGPEGLIVVDVMESVENAESVLAEFRRLSDKPIVALIYTHNHADHTFGGKGFAPDGDVEVYAHATTEGYIDRVVNVLRPAIARRSARMFGTVLPAGEDGVVNAGIGPYLGVGGHNATNAGILRPTITFEDRWEGEIAGVKVVMEHAPGETNDQIFVWLPERGVLLPGDNIYKAFPNLYTIRGTPYRDVAGWVRSLDRMRALPVEAMALGHTRPVIGREKVQETLTAYRDAIQFVHDQTIRGINRGLTPDELVETVKLPPHLATHPFLIEHYGTVAWSVRSIFMGYLGWFGGDAAFLSPAPPDARAARIVALAGGAQAALGGARAAFDEGDFAWAAELASYVHRSAEGATTEEAALVKAAALREMGYRSVSPNARNYYLTQALELEGKADLSGASDVSAAQANFVKDFPIRNILAAMPVNLNPEKALDADIVAGFRFTDTGEAFTLHVRRGVAEFRDGYPDNPDVAIETTTEVWTEIATRQRGFPGALATGAVKVPTGVTSVPRLLGFLDMFR